MSEWTRVAQPVRCKVELDKQLTVRRERGVLAQGDANANAIIAEVYLTDGQPYDLTGCTALLTFVRPDNLALPPIAAEISGNTATATLTDACYEVSGTYVATMQLRKGGDERTVLWLIGDVKGKDIDGIVDPNHEIISIEDLMATAAEAQKAANAANTAAARANAGAERAEQLQIDASGLAGDSNKLGGKPPEYYLPAVNLLDNSHFVDVVNQRGVTSASAWSYLIDRWVAFHYDSSITLDDNGLTLDVGMLVQRVQISNFRSGEAYTVALYYADGTVDVGSGTVDFGYLGQSHDFFYSTDFGCSLSVRSVTTDLDFSINKTGKAIMGAALYEGTYTADTLPPFVPRPYAVELEECRRYYRVLYRLGFSPYNVSTSIRYYRIPIEPPMRDGVAPTVTVIGPLERPLNSWTDTGAEVSVFNSSVHEFTLQAVSDITADDCSLVIDEIIISSEL